MSSLIFNGLRLEAQRATVFGVPLSGGKCRSFSNTLRREVSFPLPNAQAHSFHSHIVASQRQSLYGHHRCIRRFPSAGTAAAVSTSPVCNRAGRLSQFLSSADSGLTKSPRSLRYINSTSSSGGDLNPILPGNILRSPLPDLELDTDLPVHQVVFDACDKYKDRLAVEEFLTGRKYTYAQLKEAVVRVASALYRKGYRKGDILLAFAPNTVDFVVLIVACSAAGIWFSSANPSFTAAELARQLNHCGTTGVFTIPALTSVVKEAVASEEFPTDVKDFIVFGEADGFEPFQNLLDDDGKAFPDVDVDPVKDVFVLPYSSGTTGFPKGVMLSHHNCAANFYQYSAMVSTSSDDRLLGLLPLFHAFGQLANLFPALIAGASISYLPKFEPESFLKCLQDRKISLVHVVPPLILFLAKHPLVSNYDLTSLKTVICAAAPLSQNLTNEFLERHPNVEHFVQGFGLTETGPAVSIDTTMTIGSVGALIPNTLGKIVDPETNMTLGVGVRGEICVKGPQVMLGYYNNQTATENMITHDGWLHTGDIGYFNESGLLFVIDRLKELIKYKGAQVAPAELEALLLSHPDIQDVAVVGVPDEAAGELPRAFVVARPGSGLTEDQVTSFVEDKVASWKKLRGGVQFLDEIPKSPSGKILRRVIKAEYL